MIGDIERHDLGLLRDAGIAGRAIELVGERACRDLPGQRMFAAAGTEEEDIHFRRRIEARGVWCSMGLEARKRFAKHE